MHEAGEGHDWLYGGEGNNKIYGGKGYNVLEGGIGNDRFRIDRDYLN